MQGALKAPSMRGLSGSPLRRCKFWTNWAMATRPSERSRASTSSAIREYKAGKYEEAVPLFDQAVQARPAAVSPIAGLHSAYAEALAQLDRFGDAEAQLNEELRLFPRALAARTSLAMLYHAQRRDDRSLDRKIEIDGQQAIVSGTYRITIVRKGQELSLEGSERIRLAKGADGWKIVGGL